MRIAAEWNSPYMERINEWVLSSVRKVLLSVNIQPPKSIIDLLVKNRSKLYVLNKEIMCFLDFTDLQVICSNPVTLRSLARSRIFKSFSVVSDGYQNMNVPIEAEKVEFISVAFRNILGLRFIKTKSLTADYDTQRFDPSYLVSRIQFVFLISHLFQLISYRFGFNDLEQLNLNVSHNKRFFNSQNFLKFLDILNKHLVNLKLIKFETKNSCFKVRITSTTGRYTVSPASLKEHIGYGDKLPLYKGRAKIEFNHNVQCFFSSHVTSYISNYLELLKTEFHDFEVNSRPDNLCIIQLKKSTNVTKNIRLNTTIRFYIKEKRPYWYLTP